MVVGVVVVDVVVVVGVVVIVVVVAGGGRVADDDIPIPGLFVFGCLCDPRPLQGEACATVSGRLQFPV